MIELRELPQGILYYVDDDCIYVNVNAPEHKQNEVINLYAKLCVAKLGVERGTSFA